MIAGLNHLTLAVRALDPSVAFYHQLLSLTLHARWDTGAYLSAGPLWVCLSLDEAAGTRREDYTHYAFSVAEADFPALCARLEQAGVSVWKRNRSEGESFYFLDPDNHQLELHVGSLASRLASCREKPYSGMMFYDDE